MVIKRPAGGEAARLVADLVAAPGARAEAAAARLAVLGERAVPHALAVLATPLPDDAAERVLGLLAHLPTSRDTLAALDSALERGTPVALAATDAWGSLLNAEDAAVATRALDRLTAVALDAGRPDEVRASAVRWVTTVLGEHERTLLLERLACDASALVRSAAVTGPAAPEDPFAPGAGAESVRAFLARSGASAPLPDLHRLVLIARERGAASEGERRAEWLGARAAVHQALAVRGSTVALYDLREWLARATSPLPITALSALSAVGDATCVDAIADAHDHIDDEWTREQLRRAFAAIAERAGLGRRSAAIKRLVEREHALIAALPARRKAR